MPEVAGDAAVLVDPHSVESIQEGLELAMKHRQAYVQRKTATQEVCILGSCCS